MNAPSDAFLHDKLQSLQAQADEFIAVRRDIHKHPEMGYKEYRTSDLVAEQLSAWGYQVTRGLGGQGGHRQGHGKQGGFGNREHGAPRWVWL